VDIIVVHVAVIFLADGSQSLCSSQLSLWSTCNLEEEYSQVLLIFIADRFPLFVDDCC